MNRICSFFVLLSLTIGQVMAGTGDPLSAFQRRYQLPVLINKPDNPVLQIKVTVADRTHLNAFALSTRGTTATGDIKAVRIYYTGKDSSITAMKKADKQLFGQSAGGQEEFRITGAQLLEPGEHYFWVAYELNGDTNLDHVVSANCIAVTADGHTVTASAAEGVETQRVGVAVRQHRQDGVHTSRIPGLARTNKGTLLAIFDARYDSGRDLQGHMDIGLHRSTDNGQSWEPLQITMDMGEWGGLPQKFNGVSDACVLVDKNSDAIYIAGLWMHGVINEQGRWLEGLNEQSDDWNHQWRNKGSQPGYGVRETSQFLIVKSTDDGKTWSEPINLTRMCKKEDWWLWAPAPGNGITLADGTLVLPTQGRDARGRSFSNITYSTDGGNTWKTSQAAYQGVTECAVVQLSDGQLMLNMRCSANKGKLGDDNGRAVAVTRDLGKSWSEHPSSFNALPEPVCMASLFRHDYKKRSKPRSMLLFSNPNSKEFREHITVKISHDDGNSWPQADWILLDEGRGRGYSCLTTVDERHIGILYESSQADLVFQRIDISEYQR